MNEAIQAFVLIGFMTASLTRLIVKEVGLFGMFVRLRNLFPKDSQAFQIFNCQYCCGTYVAGIATIVLMAALGIPALWFIVIAPSALGLAYALLGLAAMIQ